MLLVPHTIAAVAIATVVKQPELALILALLSHFILDYLPHWDPLVGKLQEEGFTGVKGKTLLFILIDFLIALDLGLFFVYRVLGSQASSPDVVSATMIFLSAFLANLPDAVMIPRAFFGREWGWLMAYSRLHSRIQTKLSLPWGVLIQIAVIAIGLLVALSR